jgi:hypothetical protein
MDLDADLALQRRPLDRLKQNQAIESRGQHGDPRESTCKLIGQVIRLKQA